MSQERGRRVEELYHAALAIEQENRAAFVARAAGGDAELRSAVESLLAQNELSETKTSPDVSPGAQIGPYRIEAPIGAGGMGLVYKASDTRLGRTVAIKVCRERFSERFQREARALAALNHPNICTLHDVGPDYLVMELVKGRTLAERLRAGAIPLDEALSIALQITAALEAAHEKGIVHRDLKPQNVMLKADGTAKVLDFGLAKNARLEQGCGDSAVTVEQTQPGVIMGTVGYMAPEQARGEEINKRADIWAFGVVLYEMLTGTQPFERGRLPDTLAAVLTDAPDWRRVPGPAQRLLRRCLEKNPRRRLRDIGDAGIELEELKHADGQDSGESSQAEKRRRSRTALWMWPSMAAVALAAAVVTVLVIGGESSSSEGPVTRMTILLPPNQIMSEAASRGSGPTHYRLAVSPDGKSVVYAASTGGRSQLFIRALDEFDAKPLLNTDGANFPIFSPDGRWVAFFADGRLQKVPVVGGAPISISEVPIVGRGASWGPDDKIIFSAGEPHGLWLVSASGGTPQRITTATGGPEASHSWPHFLPDGKSVVFTVGAWGPGGLALLSLETGKWQPLLKTLAKQPRYLPSGHLVYAVEGALRAITFDLDSLRITGSPVPVLDPIFDESNAGGTEFAISDNGTLVYLPGGVNYRLVWVERSGRVTSLTGEEKGYRFPDLSPDETQLTVTVDPPDQGHSDIWIYDLSSGTGRRLTQEGHNLFSLWTPDGRRVVWECSLRLCWQSADGTRDRELLFRNPGAPQTFSPTGGWLLISLFDPDTNWDLSALPLKGEQAPISIAAGPAREFTGAISPDGRWLAFSSDESGTSEIYVQPFPGPGRKIRISRDGGTWVAWSRKNELFYVNGPQMVAVPVQTGETFRFGKPEVLFEDASLIGSGGNQRFDVTQDGQRFLMVRDSNRIQGTQLRVVMNWIEALKARVPAD